jgi:molybdopterin synthase sulfur carrier subunit
LSPDSKVTSIQVKVVIPSLLRQFTGGQEVVSIKLSGDILYNVKGCLDNLVTQFPGIRQKLYSQQGDIARYVHLFVNRKQASPDQLLNDGDELLIMLAVAGG